jgi:hypothetical protein
MLAIKTAKAETGPKIFINLVPRWAVYMFQSCRERLIIIRENVASLNQILPYFVPRVGAGRRPKTGACSGYFRPTLE